MAGKTSANTAKYNFGEKKTEFIDGQNLEVWMTPKYETSKEAAIKLLESKEYGDVLTESDFWILMNKTKSGKMAYTGLIISHDALLKINNRLDDSLRFKEEYCSEPISFDYAGKKGMMMVYRDKRDGMLEVGEITPDNCKNSYPFAMLSKRIFDRVVKRKANLIGIYSDAEAEEFSGLIDTETGEIIETKGETPIKNEETTVNVVATITLNDALSHIFDAGTNWKGKRVEELVNAKKPEAEKKKVLSMYVSRGSDNDKAACRIVNAALENATISFKNSVDIAV